MLQELGGPSELFRQLKTNPRLGISTADLEELNSRESAYGKNERMSRPQLTLWEIVLQNFEDLTLRILCVAAVVSLVIGIATSGLKDGWIEGFSILMAVVLVVVVASFNNYVKEQQFQKLLETSEEKSCMVKRNGEWQHLSIYELLVGDIAKITTGQILSVDGIVTESHEIRVDQSQMTGESDLIEKNHEKPFLISGTKLTEGEGEMLVLTVGPNTIKGKISATLGQEKDETPLQEKLQVLANQIGQLGMFLSILIFLALVFHHISRGQCVFCEDGFAELVHYFIIAVTVIVMAVPEGLPLAVTIALAYSVGKMKDENNLVRHLSACETMGGANNICTDKTGTLTKNTMSVERIFTEGRVLQKLQRKAMAPQTLNKLCEGVCVNSNADPVMSSSGYFEQIGNKTECALLELAFHLGYDYNQYRTPEKRVKVVPFNSLHKRMSSVSVSEGKYTLWTKGAPQLLLPNCKYFINQKGKQEEINAAWNAQFQSARNEFCELSLRTLLLAYKNISKEDVAKCDVSDMVVVALVGIKDPLRPEIPEAVAKCKSAGIVVRMVTGDVKQTAVAIAKQAGILPAEYRGVPLGRKGQYIVMEGKVFREAVQGLVKDSTGEKDLVKNIDKFRQIVSELRVLARSSPEDKYILATGLKQLDHVVAMTGDGGNDAMALRKADIGFAMGISGVQIAKQAAGITLLDDNFKSIVTAVKYGRNIFDCIRKFLQFQLTVNMTGIILIFAGSVLLQDSPFNAVQILWVNLIMDTLASLALATEPPSDELLERLPYSRKESIITTGMTRFIFFHTIFQVLLLMAILLKFDDILGLPNSYEGLGWDPEKGVHGTIVYSVFVYLQMFNFFNARNLDSYDRRVCFNISNNPMFIGVVVLIFLFQLFIITFGGTTFHLVPLSLGYHVFCLALGATSILWQVVYKSIVPESCLNSLTYFHIREEPENYDVDSGIMKILKRPSTYLRRSFSKMSR